MIVRKLLSAVFFALLTIFVNCSVQDAGLSGTETGNPAIIACLNSAMETVDSLDIWLPSHYLVSGDRQLGANTGTDVSADRILSKKTAEYSEDTLPHKDTIYDTVIQPHVIYVNDTIVKTHLKTDTVVNDNGSIIYKTFHIKDTLIIKDTLYKTDTTIIKRDKAGTFNNSAESPVVIQFELDSVRVRLDEAAKMVSPSDTAGCEEYLSTLTKYDSSVFSLGRYANVNGMTLSEMYSGIDGDSGLYTAPAGTVAAVRLNAHYVNTDLSIMDLEVDFDAGTDGELSTASNNRILRISRITEKNSAISENITYSSFAMSPNRDTAILHIARNSVGKNENVRFYQTQGSDPLNHNLNMLVSINKKIEFKNDSIRNITIDMVPAHPVAKGESPENVNVWAYLDIGIGRAGELYGQIDNKKRVFSGEYASEGNEYLVNYDYITGKLTKEKK